MYSLAYGMIVQVLQQLKYSGEFNAVVSSQPALRGGGRVVLLVQDGNIMSCFIFDKSGRKLYHGPEAQRLLPKFGILDWKLASSAAPTTSNAVVPPAVPLAKPVEKKGRFVSRRFTASASQTRTWSDLKRSVYFLADGTHSIEQIAMILSQPVMVIERITSEFEASGLVARS